MDQNKKERAGPKRFAICGGDRRFQLLAELLRRDGQEVLTCGGTPAALGRAEAVVLPLPTLDRTGKVNIGTECTTPEELFSRLTPGTLVLTGPVPEQMRKLAAASGLRLRDYTAGEAFKTDNAVPTAEGAIALAIDQMEKTIHGSRAVVIGAGSIGKLLALRLKALGASVTLTARQARDLSWAEALGLTPHLTDQLADVLADAEIVFGTVPAPVLGTAELEALPPDTPYIELASLPGGIAPEAMSATGRHRIIPAPGLPGKTAPQTAAEIIKRAIDTILEEEAR